MEVKIKSTRLELKENLLANKLEGAIKWATKNVQTILFGFGILIAAVLVGSVFVIRQSEARDKNWVRLAQAQALMKQKDFSTSKKILNAVKTESPNSTEGLYASYYLGEIALSEKNYEEASKLFSEVSSKAGKSPLAPLALTNLAFSLEEKGDFQASAETYRQFRFKYAEHFLAPRNQLEWGKVLIKAGNLDAAKETLNQLVDLYPTSPWAENARQILDKLASR